MILAITIGLLGLFALYAEFFLPGGILAILGGILLIASTIVFFFKTDSLAFSFIYLFFLVIAGVLLCVIALRSIRRSGRRDSFFLEKDQEGFAAERLSDDLVGKEGIVSTELKPAGHIRIEGKVYQALSQGDFVPKGSCVEVVLVKGAHVLVKSKK